MTLGTLINNLRNRLNEWEQGMCWEPPFITGIYFSWDFWDCLIRELTLISKQCGHMNSTILEHIEEISSWLDCYDGYDRRVQIFPRIQQSREWWANLLREIQNHCYENFRLGGIYL
jgi:hypothetical protein